MFVDTMEKRLTKVGVCVSVFAGVFGVLCRWLIPPDFAVIVSLMTWSLS